MDVSISGHKDVVKWIGTAQQCPVLDPGPTCARHGLGNMIACK